MKTIAWKASYIVGGWRTLFATHGEVSVPDDATEAQVDEAIFDDLLDCFTIECIEPGGDA